MKRLFLSSSLLVFILVLPFIGMAQATLTIQNTSSAIVGSTVSVNVNATGISDMVAFQFSIAYDNTKLTYLNCSDWSGGTSGNQVLINNIPSQGKIAFVYNDAAVNISNGLFFKLNFTVIGCPSSIQWSDTPTPRELSNSVPAIINCTYTNGNVQCTSIQPPVINTHPNSFVKCPGENVTFTVGATGTGTLSYQWQKNGVNVTTGSGATTNTYTLTNLSAADAATTPGYTCLVTNGGGTTVSNAGTLTISPLPVAAGTISGPSSVTQGQSYTYSVGAITFATSYSWNYTGTGATITGSGNTVNIAFSSSATSGSLFVKGINACGDGTPSNPFSIAVGGTPPVISAHPQSATRCVGSSVSFSVTASGQGTLAYQWQKNGQNVTNGTGGTTHTFTIPTVSLSDAANSPGYVCVVTNGGGSVVTNPATLTVNALPSVSLGSLTNQCANSTVYTLTSGSPAGGTYTGPGVSGTNFNASVAGPGTHTITYTYSNINGCSSSASNTITVNQLPVVTWTSPLTTQCVNNGPLPLSGGLPPGGTYGGTGVQNNHFNPSWNGAGSYTLLYTYTTAQGCINAASNTITVVNKPTIDAGPDQVVPAFSTATLSASGSPNVSYLWSTGEYTQSITVTAIDTSVYYVTATNSYGCSAYDSVRVIGVPVTQLTATLPTQSACPGQVVVPLTVDNFNSVAAISLKIGYNPLVLTYTGYQNTHPSLASGMLLVNNQNNTVQMAWFSMTPASITADTLISFLFTAVSGISSLTFEQQNPGECQFSDLNNTVIPTQFVNGMITVGTCSNLSGVLSYKNNASTPLSNTPILLKQSGNLISQTTTTTNGSFLFENLANGSYTLEPVITKTWGGVNSGDALLVMKHFVNVSPLNGLNLKAADVDGSNYVNSGDALLIAKRFVNMISSFTVGDWCAEKPSVTITGTGNVVQNIKALCYGDVDGSYTPAAKMESGLELGQSGESIPYEQNRLRIPIKVTETLKTGSFSLGLELPQSLKAIDVWSASANTPIFHQTDNILRMSWYSLIPMQLQPGEVLVELVFARNQETGKNIQIGLLAESAITNENAIPVDPLKLEYPDQIIPDAQYRIYPCPAKNELTLTWSNGKSNELSIRMVNSEGKTVMQKDLPGHEGSFQETLDISFLSPGFYETQWINDTGIIKRCKLILLP